VPDRLLSPSSESDTRFQYEVIKQLSESVRSSVDATRDVARNVSDMQKTQISMLERLAKLESNRVNEQVAKMEERLDTACGRIDVLEHDKYRRDGASGAFKMIKDWAPFLAMLFSAACVLWLYGRSVGVVPAPPVAPVRLEAAGNPNNQNIEGTVGGTP
jgi:hypothetical protein